MRGYSTPPAAISQRPLAGFTGQTGLGRRGSPRYFSSRSESRQKAENRLNFRSLNVIFGLFGKKNEQPEDDEELELVTFQGALNGKSADLQANARLVDAVLIPTKEMVSDALGRRAEMVKLEFKGERASTTLYVDGVAYAGQRYPKQQATAMVQMLKLLAGLDPKLKGRVQNGGIKAEYTELPYEILVEVSPAPEATEKVLLKSRNLKQKLTTPEELGFSAEHKLKVRELTSRKRGLVLVAGPPNSGLTTTLYGLLRSIDVYLHACYSIADKSSRDIYNFTNFEVNPEDTFEKTLERIVRAEGDIILVNPIKDAETARVVLERAKDVCIIAEMPAKDAASAVAQLMEWTDAGLVGRNLEGVFSAKLIRSLCVACREAFRPNSKLLAKVGLPEDTKTLYRKGEPPVDPKTGEEGDPCEKCGGVGYIGRTAMLECLEMTDEVRALVSEGAAIDQVKAKARSEGQLSFQKDGLRLVAQGKTSLEELQRVFKGA